MVKSIKIEAIVNGWLVEDYGINEDHITTKVSFEDRDKLVEYLQEIIPPTQKQDAFIECIDKEKKDKKKKRSSIWG